MGSAEELRSLWEKTLPPAMSVEALAPEATYRPEGITAKAPDHPGSGYDVASEIGRGGMGIVYRAHQRSLDRDVALKTLRPELDRADTVRRGFLAEAMVTGALDHPNIVPVHELTETENGEIYIAMKLVGGVAWRDLLHPSNDADRARAAEYDLDRHIEILLDVMNAVAFAHSRGIVHRDLKPENVMIGDFGEVLVMDWGLAVSVDDHPSTSAIPRAKDHGQPCGTPSYMAPELAEGRGADIGPETDVYLLGAILHEIVTGAPPHRGTSTWMVILAAARSEAPTYSTDVPKELAGICRKALARAPGDRYPTVQGFQEALRVFTKHKESLAISHAAAVTLDEAHAHSGRSSAASLDESTRGVLYGRFADAISAFRQALVLWPENEEAASGVHRAGLAYATSAFEAGDLGLARVQLERLEVAHPEVKTLLAAVDAARAEKERTLRRVGRLRRLLFALLAVLVIGAVIAFVLITRSRDEAVENLERFNQLGDVERWNDLVRRASTTLWPRVPERAPEMRRWIEDAKALSAKLPLHRPVLAEIERRGQVTTDSDGNKRWVFADATDEIRHRLLSGFVTEFDATFVALREDVTARIAYAESIVDETFVKHADAWRRCIDEVARSPKYGGLQLKPQLELVPLGGNPQSGLQEFWHIGTGGPAFRNEELGEWVAYETTGLIFVLVPGGRFLMGAQKTDPSAPNFDPEAVDNEGPVHSIELAPFFISKYEMTQPQWTRVAKENLNERGLVIADGPFEPDVLLPTDRIESWRKGNEVLQRLRLEMPTEAQWEYAARAGTSTPYWSGPDITDLEGVANVADQAYKPAAKSFVDLAPFDDKALNTAEVTYGQPNAFGLYNVHGNVMEWCRDPAGTYVDSVAPNSGLRVPSEGDYGLRALRGGAYTLSPKSARVSNRNHFPANGSNSSVGLRPVMALEP